MADIAGKANITHVLMLFSSRIWRNEEWNAAWSHTVLKVKVKADAAHWRTFVTTQMRDLCVEAAQEEKTSYSQEDQAHNPLYPENWVLGYLSEPFGILFV